VRANQLSRQIGIAFLILILAACASTQSEESSRYWASRQSFVAALETWADALRMDNARIEAGNDPLFSERDRQVALVISRQAYEIFEKTEPLLGDDSKRAEVMLAIQQINALAFQLVMLYQGSGS
jgi:hypothetical protein